MVILGIKYISLSDKPIDVFIIDGGIGKLFVTMKIIAKCGHRSHIEFYGACADVCPQF